MSNSETIRTHAAFIWSVADLLRGDDKQSEYGKVILPMVAVDLVRDQPNTRRLWRGTAAVGTIALPAQLAQSNMERCGGAGGNGT